MEGRMETLREISERLDVLAAEFRGTAAQVQLLRREMDELAGLVAPGLLEFLRAQWALSRRNGKPKGSSQDDDVGHPSRPEVTE